MSEVDEESSALEHGSPPNDKRGRKKCIVGGVAFVALSAAVIVGAVVGTSSKRNSNSNAASAQLSGVVDQSNSAATTSSPSNVPSLVPSANPYPSHVPSRVPSALPTTMPAASLNPTATPTYSRSPSVNPSFSFHPTISSVPSSSPSTSISPTAINCDLVDECSSFPNSSGWTQVAPEIIGENAEDLFGYAVSISCDGAVLAIGSSQNDGNGERAGHVRVYKTSPGGWQPFGQELNGEAAFDWFGHSVSLSGDGLRLAVGGRWNDGKNGKDSGHVRVFDYSPTSDTWVQLGEDIDGEAEGDQSGRSVSLSADGMKLAVGASGNDGAGLGAGHVRVFELVDGPTWLQLGQDIEGEADGDNSGRAVKLSPDGTRVAVGAFTNDGEGGENSGHVRVYERQTDVNGASTWTQLGQDLDGKTRGDWAGLSVSLSDDGSRVVVGIPGDNNRFWPGVSVVYELLQNGTWAQIGKPLRGGYSVDLSWDGTRVATGSHRGFSNGTNSGHAIIYDFVEDDWAQVGEYINGNPFDLSGTSLALAAHGMRVAVSSPGLDYNGTVNIGAVRIYDQC